MRLPVLGVLVLLATPVAASDGVLRIEADPPRSYAYRNAFGETEHYLVIGYRVINPGNQARRFHGVPVSVAGRGGTLNDGFRPLVQAAFCREQECPRDSRSTAEIQGVLVAPGRQVHGLAVFPLRSVELPNRVEIRAGSGAPVEVRRVGESRWASGVTAGKPAAPAQTRESPKPQTRTATAPQPGDAEPRAEALRSWRVVHSGLRPPSGIGR